MKFKTKYEELYKNLATELEKSNHNFKDKEVVVEVKQYRKSRSVGQNGLLWSILEIMAKSLTTTSEEVYIDMLKSYGVKVGRPIGIEKDNPQYEEILKTIKYYEIKTDGINAKLDYIFVILGSSTYNTKQMTDLIDGIMSECKHMGIYEKVKYYSAEMRSLLDEKI